MTRRALIFGISGQDGAYLAQLLIAKGYAVTGTSRDAAVSSGAGLRALGVHEDVRTVSAALVDFRSVLTTIRQYQPDEIYNLAGQSSVGLSFEQPVETMESIVFGTLNILEAMRFEQRAIRFYNAGSGESFGDTRAAAATEDTAFRPRSPYAVAKSSAHQLLANYREAYGLYACTGILFNHESPLRPTRFVTQKIIGAAARIASGSPERLVLGNIGVTRDWGWAPEYVEAMWLMLQQASADDYIIATGRSETLSYFAESAFACCGLNWRDHTDFDQSLLRPSEIECSRADPAKASDRLGWSARSDVDAVVRRMCDAARERLSRAPAP
jgi:GDPmannose 4,6-dehydratase